MDTPARGPENGIRTPNCASVLLLEAARSLLNRFAIRGRCRLGSMVSRLCVPKGRIRLPHRLGGAMVFDFSNIHEISMYFDFFAPDLSRILARELRPGDTFVDCGANIGYFSCLASSRVGPIGKVVSIDANPYCVERIQESRAIGGYENMDIVPCAVGERDGEIAFNLADDPMYSSVSNLNALEFTSTESTIIVPLRRLDDVLRDSGLTPGKRVRLLKLDVEGAEIDVIRGAADSIEAKSLDYIYVEVHEKQIRLRGQAPEELFSLMAARGFTCAERLGANVFLYESVDR